MKISVVISAYNEEQKIEGCLKSVKNLALEIIFIDNKSTDKTIEIAKKYTDKIYIRDNNLMLNLNKNFGFSRAVGDWIFSLDSDERITDELADEIKKLTNGDIAGYYIPRKNIIFGKWIEHTGWYPDYQLRLFKRGNGKFEEKHVHEMLKIDGKTAKLTSPILHLNYENITQFLNKMIQTYTVSEAENLIRNGYKYNPLDAIKMPVQEFLKRFFAEKGYQDGLHGLVLSILQSFYHFVVFLRLWEADKFPDSRNSLELFNSGKKMISKETAYWLLQAKIDEEKNATKKNLLKLRRKLLS